jgi:hypothetical protein
MKIKSDKIELFQNLSQLEFDNRSFDLHNDFDCLKVKFQNNVLILVFQNIENDFLILISFQKTMFTFFEFDFTETFKTLTIDNLYRGKYEVDGMLIEFNNDRGYFYLEFYEGQKIEFWSESIDIERY